MADEVFALTVAWKRGSGLVISLIFISYLSLCLLVSRIERKTVKRLVTDLFHLLEIGLRINSDLKLRQIKEAQESP